MKTNINKRKLIPFLVVATAVVAVLAIINPENIRIKYESVLAHSYKQPTEKYPSIDKAGLNETQIKIIDLTRIEYAKKPVSFDKNVLKYSQGYSEPWCANFTSWIMNQAGVPYENPNSGSWRVPGVSTLQEYYQINEQYAVAGTYKPQVGDVAIYKENRSHANIVIAVNADMMTTVGGNENGHVRLNTQSYKKGEEGLSGFGKLANRMPNINYPGRINQR